MATITGMSDRIGQQSEGPAVQAEGLQVRVEGHSITPQVADGG